VPNFQAVYYRAADGAEPVSELIDRLDPRRQAILHIFRKDSGPVPRAEIKIANQRWEDLKARMDAGRRHPPRAAGRDAP